MRTDWIGSGFLFFAFGVLSGVACAADTQGALYRWTDADGRMQFSDRPPAEQPFTVVPRVRDPSPESAAEARERAEAVQRMADDLAQERRQREERAAAARELRQPEPTPVEPRIEIHRYPWYPSRPYRPVRPWPPVFPPWHSPRPPYGHPGYPTPDEVSPRPPAWTPPRRAPEFQWPRPRAPELQN